MKQIQKFWEGMAMAIKTDLAYVASAWTGILVNVMQIIIFYYIWMAIYGERSDLHGINKAQIISYIVLTRILYMGVSFGVNLWISWMIREGQIAVELLKPFDFQMIIFSGRMGGFLSYLVTSGIPVMLIALLIIGISLPASFLNGAVFVLSLIMAVTISFLVDFTLGLLSFYTANGWGIEILKQAVINFFSGALVPLVFFPEWLKTIVNYLPFKDIVYTPVSIYLGMVQGSDMVRSLAVQFMWVALLFIISRTFFAISIKKVTVQGG